MADVIREGTCQSAVYPDVSPDEEFRLLRIALLLIHGSLVATVCAMLVVRGLPKACSWLVACRSWVCAAMRSGQWASGENSDQRKKIEKRSHELRVQFLVAYGPLLVFALMAMAFAFNILAHGREGTIADESEWKWRKQGQHIWLRYFYMVPLHIYLCVTLLALLLLKPTSVSPRLLNGANVMTVLCVAFAMIAPPQSETGSRALRAYMPHLFIQFLYSFLCGDSRVSALLGLCSWLFVAMQWTACIEDQSLIVRRYILVGLFAFLVSLLYWVAETWILYLGRLQFQKANAVTQASLIERLLSRTCDACIFLGPRLEVVKGTGQLGALLLRDGDPESFRDRAFTEFAVDSEKDKVAEFLGLAYRSDEEGEGAEQGSHANFLPTRLRDTLGGVVHVHIFHACVGTGDDRIHVVGILEDQDREDVPASLTSQRCQVLRSRLHADSQGPDSLSDSSDSSVDANAAAAAAYFESEIHVDFKVVDAEEEHGLEADSFKILSCSPPFQALFGIPSSSSSSMASLFADARYDSFEQWVTQAYVSDAWTGGGARAFKRLTFYSSGLESVGVSMKALCSIAPHERDLCAVRLTLHHILWSQSDSRSARESPQGQATDRQRRSRRRSSHRGAARSSDSPGTPPAAPEPLRLGMQRL